MLMTLGEMPARARAAFGDRPAVIFEDVAYSFEALDRRAGRFANALAAAGIEPGDRVTLCAPNSFDWMAAYYGTAKAGAVLNPITSMLTAGEIGYIAGNCGAKLLLAGPGKGEALFEALADTAVERVVLAADEAPDGAQTYEDFIANMPEAFEIRPRGLDELGAIGYTSGTTGHPKGAMMSNRAIAVGTAGTALMHGRTAADTTVSALPLSHVYGMAVMNCGLLTGAALVLLERFEAEAMLRAVERYRATMLEAVPTGFMYMLADPAMETYDLSSLERMTTGGQTIPPATAAEVEEKFGAVLLELWGMTELAGPGTTHAAACERRLGSIGVALPYVEARIGALEDSAATAPVDEPGELLIRGPIVPMGYFGNEDATKEAFDGDGWFRTGDVAYPGRGRLHLDRGPPEGHDQHRRLQRLSGGAGACAGRPSRCLDGRGRRRAGPREGRARQGLYRAAPRRRADGGRHHGPLPQASRALQGAAARPVRPRPPGQLHRQDPPARTAHAGRQRLTAQAPACSRPDPLFPHPE